MKQYVAAKAERIELTLCENIAFSGGAPPKMTSSPFAWIAKGWVSPKKESVPASRRIAHIARNTAQTAYLY